MILRGIIGIPKFVVKGYITIVERFKTLLSV